MNYAFWAQLLVQSGLVLLVCQAVHFVPRRTDAAQQYRIALFGFLLLALLPAFSAVLPPLPFGNWLHHRRAFVTISMGPLIADPAAGTSSTRWQVDWFLLAWSAGVVFALGWLVMGRIAIWRMSRHATALQDAERLELANELSGAMGLRRRPQMLVGAPRTMPATFGIFHPRIVLPVECMEWSERRWRMVLLHELAHILRRDVAAQFFVHTVCAFWWFQPLAWIVRRQIRQSSERACDAFALSFGMRASDYASELVAIAREARLTPIASCAAIGMASARLEERIEAILRPQKSAARMRGLAAMLLLAAFGITVPAIDLGGSPMKRTLFSGLLASASLSAATIGGTVLDPSGAVIPNANVLLINPDTSTQQQTASAADGKFSFDNLPAGQYILRVEKPGFAALFREYTVKADANVARALVMQLGHIEENVSVQGTGKANAAPAANSKPIRVGGNVAESNLIRKVQPVYPPSAKAAGVQGTVTIEAVILKDGTPASLDVLSSPSDDLSESALEAVRQWRYRPTLLNGEPVEVVTDIQINYTLSQ
ncbi:MAG TPA: M56 family metallopeptidase [Bryobacteraceae bacterium]|jgi:TonB family protein|nr:M56 family metallopeptidase [Bryobacteraceae bacterium]